jgi:eukaryotic-like serine/threonine-protein kinase
MSAAPTDKSPEVRVGRYAIFDEIASGGMATVHLARVVGSAGFSRVVAAKRMHRHFLQEPEFKRMFLVEAQLAARILHPNVVPILDVLSHDDELIIVMEYVHGESLHALLRTTSHAKRSIPLPVGCAIGVAVLQGLHAAHEARNEQGAPLGIVHRDVSPQNVLVGADGVARVLDFGIAKAVHAQNQTNPGSLKGKFSYMAPEVINGSPITRQADVFSAGIVVWEVLTGKMLFKEATEHERLLRIMSGRYPSVREVNPAVTPALAWAVEKALQLDAKARYATALEFAIDIERATALASQRVVGEWVRQLAADALDERAGLIHEIEISNVQDRQDMGPPDRTPPPVSIRADEPITHSQTNTPSTVAFGSAERQISLSPGSATPTYALFSAERLSAILSVPNRRRRLVGAIAIGAVALGLALTVARLVAGHPGASVPAMPAPAARATTPLPVVVEPLSTSPAREAVVLSKPAIAMPSTAIQSPVVVDRSTKRQRPARQAIAAPARVPARSSNHAKPYLPSEL